VKAPLRAGTISCQQFCPSCFLGYPLAWLVSFPSFLPVFALVVHALIPVIACAVTKLHYYLPWTLTSAVLSVTAHALLSTLSPTTPTGRWIGYQVLAGAGRGAGLQMGIVAVQNHLAAAPELVPVALSIVIFCQNLGAAVWLCIANTLFTNRLRAVLAATAPGLDAGLVVAAGGSAEGVGDLVDRTGVPLGVLRHAFAESVDLVFLFLAAVSGAMVLLAFGMGVKTKSGREKDAAKEVKT
jgi:hypothetical protein